MKKRLALCVAACALFAGNSAAQAGSALVGNVHASELRVAYASAQWTTVWTSFRVDDAGAFGVIVPLPPGAYVDQSTDAFFEALEIATAPRVFPPEGLNPTCPDESGPAHPFEIAGVTAHVDSLSPQLITLVNDAPAAASWADSQGLTLEPSVQNALAAAGAERFLCVRFTSPEGGRTTPTLRVSAPAGLPFLPFSITKAGATNLRVTTWLLGQERGALDGTAAVTVPAASIAWNAKTSATDYRLIRDALLASQPDGATLEATGHDALATPVPIAEGTATIAPVTPTYFERASMYGAAPPNHPTCTLAATDAFSSDKVVSPWCPRGDLVIPFAELCSSPPAGPGEIGAESLLCGPAADDLALAFAGSVPQDAVLTRRTFVIAQGEFGAKRSVLFEPGPAEDPVIEAGNIDVADCFGLGGAGGSTGTTTSSSTTSSTGQGGAPQGGSGSGATGFGALGGTGGSYGAGNSYGYGAESSSNIDPSVYADAAGCACNGTVDTVDTGADTAPASDDCSGDTTGTTGDDCSGDTGSVATDDCSGDTTGGADSCSGDTAGGADSCSGDSVAASDCAMTRLSAPKATGPDHRRIGPRLSVLTLAALAVVFPLRRRGTKKRRA